MQGDLREYAVAIDNLEKALAVFRAALPADHPYTATCLNNLGSVQQEQGNDAAAKICFQEALEIVRKAFPEGDPVIANTLNNLGATLLVTGEYGAAKQNLSEALAIYRKALSPGHPLIAACLSNLGLIETQLREYAAAKRHLGEALDLSRLSLPKDHKDIARSLADLGWLSLISGENVREAVSQLAEASEIYQAEQLRMAVVQAEGEQLATALGSMACLDLLFDATLASGLDPSSAYAEVLRVKGSVTAQQRWARAARNTADPLTRSLLEDLRQVSRDLIGLSAARFSGESHSFRSRPGEFDPGPFG